MAYRSKKYLSLLLTTALINSSIQPLYASFPEHEDDIVREAKAHSRMMMLEDALQAKIKNSASFIESWTPSFIKNAATKVGSWVESTLKDLPASYFAKSPFEIDYGHDQVYWQAHFSAALEEIKEQNLKGAALQERLTDLQELVFQGTLSPYTYERGLQDIEAVMPVHQSLFKLIREDFKSALKAYPGLIDETFRREASLYIQDLQTDTANPQELISLIRYYRSVDNALDYKAALTAVRSYLQQNKKTLTITKHAYNTIIEALNTEIGRTSKAERKHLKANRAFFLGALSVLPYYGQEWDEIKEPTNNALPLPSKKESTTEDYLAASTKILRKALYKGAQFVQEHPGQAMMMVLAGQVTAGAAFKALSVLEAFKGASVNSKGSSIGEENTTQSSVDIFKRPIKRNVEDEFQVNQYTNNTKGHSSVVPLINGNVLITWECFDQYGDLNANIYGRIFSSNGTALGNEIGINHVTYADQEEVSAVGLTSGDIFISWAGSQASSYDVYGRLFAENGTALNDDFGINRNLTAYQDFPSVAQLTNGNVFVAWRDTRDGNYDIYGRLFAENGTALNDDFGMNQNKTYAQDFPSIIGLISGNVFGVWQGRQTGDYDIYGNIFAANGTALGPEFKINQNTISAQQYPKVAGLTNGNIFVVWQGNQTGDRDIYGRVFFINGMALGPEFRINQNINSNQYVPSIASLTDGNILAVWQGNQTGDFDIYGRVIFPNGTILSNEFSVNQVTTSDQTNPSVAALANGNVFVAWHGEQTGDPHIYGRILSAAFLESLMMPALTTGTTGTTGIIGTTATTGTSGTTGFSGATGLVTTGMADTTGTTGSLVTAGTTGLTTTQSSTSPTSSTGAMSTIFVTTADTSLTDISVSSSSSDNNLLLLVGATAGGAVVLAGGASLGYYLYKRNKKPYSFHNTPRVLPPLESHKLSEEFELVPTQHASRSPEMMAALASFRNLRDVHPKLKSLEKGHPSCFISYAWGNKEQEDTVHTLAADLKGAGINVLLDIWHNRGGTSTLEFAQKILDPKTDFVVLCGSKKLMDKLDENNENESVVRVEVLDLIAQRVTWARNKRNILPILLEGQHKEVLPQFLWNMVSIGFQKKEDYCLNCFSLLQQLYKLEHDDLYLEKIKTRYTNKSV